MAKVKITMNRAGLRELLHSPEIRAALQETGEAVQGRAGDNFGVFPFNMPTRSVVRVSAVNMAGQIENSDNNVLLKALHGGDG